MSHLIENLKALFIQKLHYREENVPSSKENVSAFVKIVEQSFSTMRREIDDWKAARSQAYNPLNPERYNLMYTYDDAMLDLHLSAIAENRALRTINKVFKIAGKDGKVDDKKSKLFHKAWFEDYLTYLMESPNYGYSPVLLYFKHQQVSFTKLLPRKHVNPDKNIIVEQVGQEKGMALDDKKLKKYLLNLQLIRQSMGKLEKVVPLTILKRHSWGSWDEFEKKFGMPIVIAKTASRDPKAQAAIETWLRTLGRAAHGIFPMNTQIDLHERKQTDAFEVFMKKIESVNAEISKFIDGQTMNADNGSSRSQAEVHENTANERTKADIKKVIMHLNDVLIPFLKQHSFYATRLAEGDYFIVEEKINKEKQITIDKELLTNGYVLTQDYIEQTYGVEIERMPSEDTSAPEPMRPKKKSLRLRVNELYHLCCGEQVDYQLNDEPSLEAFFEAFAKFVHEEQEGVAEFLMTATAQQLLKAYVNAFKPNTAFGHPDLKTMAFIRENLFRFSAAKTLQQQRELNVLLYDEAGNLLPFTEFQHFAREIYQQYNEAWLRAEREMVFITGQAARQWSDIQETKAQFPYLVYNTVGDARVRPSHRALEGTKLPADHPFWDTYYPPNGWLCRCFVTQSDNAEGIANAEDALAKGAAAMDKKGVFAYNAGKVPQAFSPDHPYFTLTRDEITHLEKSVNKAIESQNDN